MRNFLLKNKSSFYHSSAVLIKALSGPVTFVLLAENLTETEQGLFFAFISLGALQILFEAGISTSLVQHLSSEKELFGRSDKYYGFLKIGFLWCSISALGLLCLAMAVSNYIFADFSPEDWWGSFFAYVLAVGVNLLFSFVYIVAEGEGDIEFVYRTRFLGALTSIFMLWFSLFSGFQLYTLALSQFGLLLPLVLNKKAWLFFVSCRGYGKVAVAPAFGEIIGFQSRLAVVWITGYLYWHSPVLIIFKFVDPVYAGKFGLTFSLMNAVSQVGQGWVMTQRVLMGKLVTSGDEEGAHKLFNLRALVSTGLVFLSLSALGFLKYTFTDFLFFSRTLDELSFICMALYFLILTHLANLATYSRCFKQEPLFGLFIVMNISVPFVLYYYGVSGDVHVGLAVAGAMHLFFILFAQLKMNRFLNYFWAGYNKV